MPYQPPHPPDDMRAPVGSAPAAPSVPAAPPVPAARAAAPAPPGPPAPPVSNIAPPPTVVSLSAGRARTWPGGRLAMWVGIPLVCVALIGAFALSRDSSDDAELELVDNVEPAPQASPGPRSTTPTTEFKAARNTTTSSAPSRAAALAPTTVTTTPSTRAAAPPASAAAAPTTTGGSSGRGSGGQAATPTPTTSPPPPAAGVAPAPQPPPTQPGTTVAPPTTAAATPTTAPPPTVQLSGPVSVTVGVQATISVSAQNATRGTWAQDCSPPNPTEWAPGQSYQGTWTTGPCVLSLTVYNAAGVSATASTSFTVVNPPPTVAISGPATVRIGASATWTVDASASATSGTWAETCTTPANPAWVPGGSYTAQWFATGSCELSLTVQDAAGQTAIATFPFQVTLTGS